MSALTDTVKVLIAKHLNTSTLVINKVTIIIAFPYSEHTIDIIEKTFERDGLAGLAEIDFKKLDDNVDSIIVCTYELKDKKSFVSLIFDPEKLYQTSTVLKTIPIN